MRPEVSVLIPARDVEAYVGAAVASILRQTFRNWELVAVNDGSTDRTGDILAAAAAADSRIRVLSPDRPGLVGALNTGLAACRGKYVARMDADDISHPARLELQIRYLDENRDVSLVATRFRHFPRGHLRRGMLRYEEWQNRLLTHDDIMRDLFVESPFVHPSVMFRTEKVTSLGGYRNERWPEDYDLWLRLAGSGAMFARLPQTLLFWRDRETRATRTMEEYAALAFRRCKASFLDPMFLKGEKGVVLAGAGVEGRAWQRVLREFGISVEMWLDVDPRKRGRILHGAPVADPRDFQPGKKVLVAIGTPEGRESGRKWAKQTGMTEGVDFLCIS